MAIDAGRSIRGLLTAVVVIVLFAPVIRNQDSFPLSTQPMYATARDGVEWLPSARGVNGRTGDQTRLSMAIVADTDDPLIAKSRLEQGIRSDGASSLCDRIAERVAVDADLRGFDLVEIISEQFDLVDFVANGAEPLDLRVHARCLVSP